MVPMGDVIRKLGKALDLIAAVNSARTLWFAALNTINT